MADNSVVLVTDTPLPTRPPPTRPPSTRPQDSTQLRRIHFDKEFVFGTASSAYQVEGGAREGGNGVSIWDSMLAKDPTSIAHGHNGLIACDTYNLYKRDVVIMKTLGVDTYRFSISWSRVLPGGCLARGVNQEGIDYYNSLINELLANGIEPYVTLFHWDTPQELQDEYEGFTSPKIVEDFGDYAELCFWKFGDRVKHWITVNEPHSYVNISTFLGGPRYSATETQTTSAAKLKLDLFEPRIRPASSLCCSACSDAAIEPYLVAHHLILSHSKAVEVYRNQFQKLQKGEIGLSLNSSWLEPLDPENSSDHDAVIRGQDFQLGWFLGPVIFGRYPASMRRILKHRLPSDDQLQGVKGSYDFIGVNYYRAEYATTLIPDDGPLSFQTDSLVRKQRHRLIDGEKVPIGPMNGSMWINVYPRGLYELLLYIKKTYNDPTMMITENGFDEQDNPHHTLPYACADPWRTEYIRDHLFYLYQAIQAGAKVKGYFYWSFCDNFEWTRGYENRMGVIHIDYKSHLARHPKSSAKWYQLFLGKTEPISPAKRQLEDSEENNSNKRLKY